MSPHSPELYTETTFVKRDHALSEIHGRCDFVPPKTSHHAKKIVRNGRFLSLADTDRLRAARETWWVVLLPFKPAEPLTGPLALTIDLTWPWRKSDGPKVRLLGKIPSDVKPDCDNVAKGIVDTMARLRFMEGDQQIAALTVRKWIGGRPGLEFSLSRLAARPRGTGADDSFLEGSNGGEDPHDQAGVLGGRDHRALEP